MGFLSAKVLNSANLETRFNEVASKGSKLGEGTYESSISSIEFNPQYKSLKITFKSSEEDKFHTQFLFIVQRVYDQANGRLTDEEEISVQYIQLMLGLGFTSEQATNFLIAANENTSLFQALTGLGTKIKIERSQHGAKVVRTVDGKLSLEDAGNGKHVDILEQLADGKVFEDFSEVNEFVKSTNKAIRIAYLEVKSYAEVSGEVSNANREAVQTAVEAAGKAVQGKVASIL